MMKETREKEQQLELCSVIDRHRLSAASMAQMRNQYDTTDHWHGPRKFPNVTHIYIWKNKQTSIIIQIKRNSLPSSKYMLNMSAQICAAQLEIVWLQRKQKLYFIADITASVKDFWKRFPKIDKSTVKHPKPQSALTVYFPLFHFFFSLTQFIYLFIHQLCT